MNAFLGHLIAMLMRIAATHKARTPAHANLVTPETERTVLVRWVLFLSCCCYLLLTRRWSKVFSVAFYLSFPFIFFLYLAFLFLSFPFLFFPFLSISYLTHHFLAFPFFSIPSFSVPFLFSPLPSLPIRLFSFFLSFPFLSSLYLSIPLFSSPLPSFPFHHPFEKTDVRKYLEDRCVPYGAQFQISDEISLLFIRTSSWQGQVHVCRRITSHIQISICLMQKVKCLSHQQMWMSVNEM